MKYKELEKIATELSYSIRKDKTNTIIKKYNEEYDRTDVIFIDELERDKIIVHIVATCRRDLDMLHGAMNYATTAPEERQEEKKNYLRHRFLEAGFFNYLNRDYRFPELFLNSEVQIHKQTQFTQEEIDEIKEKYDTTLDDFEQIEVEDEE